MSVPKPPSSVLLLTPRWTRDGGVSAHVQTSAAALAADGVEVTVAVARVENEERPTGVRIVCAPRMFDASLPPAERLAELVGETPELIHFHQVDVPELVAHLRPNAAVVVSAHAYTACPSGVHYFRPGQECARAHGPACFANMLGRGCAHTRHLKTLPRKYRNSLRGLRALQQADVAISYSTAVDRHLADNGISRRAIVPYFPTMGAAPGQGHAERRRIVFAGRIVAPKGVGVLLRAARRVEAEFRICGDGRELEAMRALARRLGLERRVTFTGWLDGPALARELAAASLVVMPSVWPEPFGLVPIEGFAAGRPAVASAAGGVGDWLEHGVNGFGVPPGDADALARALAELVADPERQQRMGEAGLRTVSERFSVERHLEALREVYAVVRTTVRADH